MDTRKLEITRYMPQNHALFGEVWKIRWDRDTAFFGKYRWDGYGKGLAMAGPHEMSVFFPFSPSLCCFSVWWHSRSLSNEPIKPWGKICESLKIDPSIKSENLAQISKHLRNSLTSVVRPLLQNAWLYSTGHSLIEGTKNSCVSIYHIPYSPWVIHIY